MEERLSKLRDGSLLLLKVDFGALAAIATLISILQLDGRQLLESINDFRVFGDALFILIGFGLILDWMICLARINHTKIQNSQFILLQVLYTIQVLLHSLALTYLFGFYNGFFDGFTDARP